MTTTILNDSPTITSSGSLITTIFALGGDDIVQNIGGPKEIYAGDGNDYLSGSAYLSSIGNGSYTNPIQLTGFLPINTDDFLFGGNGDDAIYGYQGNDYISGGVGNESGSVFLQNQYWLAGLWGGDGHDFIYGDAGNDTLYGEADNDYLNGGTGLDYLLGGTGDDVLFGGADADTADGGAGADTIYGEGGLDLIYGGTENDEIYSGSDFDTIYGDAGNDEIHGGRDNDLIVGGAGVDFLYGGSGSDTFRFNGIGDKSDKIYDFALTDTMAFRKAGFGNLSLGTVSSSAYRENNSGLAGDASDRFIYDLNDGKLYYDSNGSNAGGTKFLVVTLTNEINISRYDLEIVA